jgi:phosphoribosylaminoimidazole-succinocarboxamide synthase
MVWFLPACWQAGHFANLFHLTRRVFHMAMLSPARVRFPLLQGLQLLSRGKVRDTYVLSDDKLLSVATDGISIFDFVLNASVPLKGTILNGMNHFWTHHLRGFGVDTHLVAVGSEIDCYLPDNLRGNIDLHSRASVIRRLKMAPVEFICRAVLTGSSVGEYEKNREVCGHRLPAELQDGDELPCLLDTPTTKAEVGHDENLSALEVRQKYPEHTYQLLRIFQICSAYAKSNGILIADTKFEFGEDGTLADEILTPDSSRFWEMAVWLASRKPATGRKAPPPYDKQLVRAWGIEKGIKGRKPEKDEDVAWVHSLGVPEQLIKQTTWTYRYIFWRLTGYVIEEYLGHCMGVYNAPKRAMLKICILCGSESDLSSVKKVVSQIRSSAVGNIMSCHRNPLELLEFAGQGCGGADVVICAGGKAFALPGVLDALLHAKGYQIPVVGVALGEPGSKALQAAQLSIEEIPGTPVVMDEISGQCYTGEPGLYDAIARVMTGELPPPKPRAKKPVQMNVLAG